MKTKGKTVISRKRSERKENKNDAPENRDDQQLQDTSRDEEALQQDETEISLPDVDDIPGQKNIKPAPMGEMADTTISSDDEEGVREGKDMLQENYVEDEDTRIVMGTEADVTNEDLEILGAKDQDMDMGDDELVRKEGLEDRDADGDFLNEAASDVDTTGDDLDVPEADMNEPDEDAMGQGDEENNYFSLGSDDNDNLKEGNP